MLGGMICLVILLVLASLPGLSLAKLSVRFGEKHEWHESEGLTFVQHVFWGLQEGSFEDYPVYLLNAEELTALCDLEKEYEDMFARPNYPLPPNLGVLKNQTSVAYFQSRMNNSIVLVDQALMPVTPATEPCMGRLHYDIESVCLLFPGSVIVSYSEDHLPPWVFANSWYSGYKFSERKRRVGNDQMCVKLAMGYGTLAENVYGMLNNRTEDAFGNLKIDLHPLGAVFHHPLTRFVFQYLFGGTCFLLCFMTISFIVIRSKRTRTKTKTHMVVLSTNLFVLFFLGIIFFLNGYGSVGRFDDAWNNSLRVVLFGTGVAMDIALAKLWDEMITDLIVVTNGGRKRNLYYYTGMVICITSDVVMFSAFHSAVIPLEMLRMLLMVFPLIMILLQVFVIVRLSISTTRILKMLNEALTVVGKESKTHKFQQALIRRLAFWIRVSMVAASFSIVALMLMSTGILYLTSPTGHILMNALLCTSRIMNAMAQVMVAAPPPSTMAQIYAETAVVRSKISLSTRSSKLKPIRNSTGGSKQGNSSIANSILYSSIKAKPNSSPQSSTSDLKRQIDGTNSKSLEPLNHQGQLSK